MAISVNRALIYLPTWLYPFQNLTGYERSTCIFEYISVSSPIYYNYENIIDYPLMTFYLPRLKVLYSTCIEVFWKYKHVSGQYIFIVEWQNYKNALRVTTDRVAITSSFQATHSVRPWSIYVDIEFKLLTLHRTTLRISWRCLCCWVDDMLNDWKRFL